MFYVNTYPFAFYDVGLGILVFNIELLILFIKVDLVQVLLNRQVNISVSVQ